MKQLIFILICTTALAACKGITVSGNIKTEKRNVGSFSGIASSGSIEIEVSNGPDYSVEVEGDDNVLEYIITDVKGGNLDVHYKHNMSFTNTTAKVYVTAPGYKLISVHGSGSIDSKGMLQQDAKMDVRIDEGSGSIELELDAPEVVAFLKGSGSLKLKGKTRNLDATLTGSGDLRCSELLSENTTVAVKGSGSANVFASVMLKARTDGSGDILYYGNPVTKDIKESGHGSITGK